MPQLVQRRGSLLTGRPSCHQKYPHLASSGKTTRYRLNRGGDRQANAALYRIVLTRMSSDPRTRDYVQRRRAEGLSNREIMRCLKRYVAKETFKHFPRAA